jgi:hypothetical protein
MNCSISGVQLTPESRRRTGRGPAYSFELKLTDASTRDTDPAHRVPILGLGALPNLDEAAKIAVLIFSERATIEDRS